MKLGYTIVYVEDVQKTLDFYEKAFGFEQAFISDEKDYGELKTGETTISFASIKMATDNIGVGITNVKSLDKPAGMEMAMLTENIDEDFQRALDAGAVLLEPVKQKPWGQRVGYLKDLNGVLIEICTPVNQD